MSRRYKQRRTGSYEPFKASRLLKKAVVLLAALASLWLYKIFPQPGYDQIAVVKVYDGDTIKVANGEHVRLIGIDCPELHESDKLYRDARRTGQDIATIQAMGREAYEFASDLLAGKRVRLEFDVERRDKYGRLLAYVFTREDMTGKTLRFLPKEGVVYLVEQDGRKYVETFVNAMIISEGYAQPMSYPPNTMHADLFQRLYQEARENRRGLWREK